MTIRLPIQNGQLSIMTNSVSPKKDCNFLSVTGWKALGQNSRRAEVRSGELIMRGQPVPPIAAGRHQRSLSAPAALITGTDTQPETRK